MMVLIYQLKERYMLKQDILVGKMDLLLHQIKYRLQ